MDTDGDSMPDGWEATNSLNPNEDDSSLDPDNDGLQNKDEYTNNTDPNDADTDDDGYSDGYEVSQGTDPTDPTSYPTTQTQIPGFTMLYIMIILGILGLIFKCRSFQIKEINKHLK
ncbi:MAG: hypothetical protein ACTSPQ_18560 [Candidatus Helarchaeota archaeon]